MQLTCPQRLFYCPLPLRRLSANCSHALEDNAVALNVSMPSYPAALPVQIPDCFYIVFLERAT